MATHPVDNILARHPQVTGNLITVLHEVQSHYNYLPQDALYYLAQRTGIPITRLYSIATFYHFFSFVPKGKHRVTVCLGTACYVKGASKIVEKLKSVLGIDPGQTSPDGQFSVEAARCLGSCALAPVMVVDEKVYGNVQPDNIPAILAEYGFDKTGKQA